MTRPTTFPSKVSSASYSRKLVALDLHHAKRAIHPTSVVLPRNRLLARIAAFLEIDRSLIQPGLRRKDPVVDLTRPARRTGFDPEELELVVTDGGLVIAVEHFTAATP